MKKIGLAVIQFLVGLVGLSVALTVAFGAFIGLPYGLGRFVAIVFLHYPSRPPTEAVPGCWMVGTLLLVALIGFGCFLYGAWKAGEVIVRKVRGG
jgi:hypothetical protein